MTTRIVKWLSAFVVLVMLTLAVPQTASAEELPTVTITEDTVLTADLNAHVVIGADGITLDGAGHKIIGETLEYDGWDPGISLIGRSGVTIKNCRVIGWFNSGIYLRESSYNKIINNTVDGSYRKGIWVFSGDHNVVTNNTATRIGKTWWGGTWDVFYGGFDVWGRTNFVTNNTAVDIEGNGFIGGCLMRGNTATGCQVGFLVGGRHSYLEGNLAYGNLDGFHLKTFCSYSTLVNNTACGNRYGFFLDGWEYLPHRVGWVSHNHMVGNTVINNWCAFYLHYADHNMFLKNVGYGNEYNIAKGDGCEHNKFVHNVFVAAG